jgi:hypothetical protein
MQILAFSFAKYRPGHNDTNLFRGGAYNVLDDLWWFFPDGDAWSYATIPYTYSWMHKRGDHSVFRSVFFIYAETSGLNTTEPAFLFTEFDPQVEAPDDFLLYGYTMGESVRLLDEDNLPQTIEHDLLIGYFVGYPSSWRPSDSAVRTVVFPLANGELAVCYYDIATNPIGITKFVINEYDAPYLYPTLNVPYDPASYGYPEVDYYFPVCIRVDETEGIYLYWEEYCEFGDVVARLFPTTIYKFKFGSPYSGWIDFPTAPGKITGFTPVKITWDHRIVLASVYIAGENGGTFSMLLDTEKNSDWILGSRFSTERLDRCTPAIFGEHPYVRERMRYTGTQWAWDYTISDNYPQ